MNAVDQVDPRQGLFPRILLAGLGLALVLVSAGLANAPGLEAPTPPVVESRDS